MCNVMLTMSVGNLYGESKLNFLSRRGVSKIFQVSARPRPFFWFLCGQQNAHLIHWFEREPRFSRCRTVLSAASGIQVIFQMSDFIGSEIIALYIQEIALVLNCSGRRSKNTGCSPGSRVSYGEANVSRAGFISSGSIPPTLLFDWHIQRHS